ncbi:MAG: hypothetical protein N3F05_04510 [Candidatus Diapherotrites archaeon]|nr:hypothetical protein [Candidatus Diapherotrites archaeon]
MDTLMIAVSIVLMMLFMQYGQLWIVFGIFMVMILTSRSFSTTAVILLALVLTYMARDMLKDLWLVIAICLIVLALVLSFKKESRTELSPDIGFGAYGQEEIGMG